MQKRNVFISILAGILLLLSIYLIPIPSYRKEEIGCRPDSVTCMRKGWHLGPTIYEKIVSPKLMGQPIKITPFKVTLNGTSVCLPHKDTINSHTLECAFGLQTGDNSYYSLDMSNVSFIGIPTNTSITVSGDFDPTEANSSKYNIKGIIKVTNLERK